MGQLNEESRAEALAMIRRAKLSHVRWRAYAQGLVAGVPVDNERVPVRHTDCKFGQWYFGDGMRSIGHLSTYAKVREHHERLHSVYAEVHDSVVAKDFSRANAKLEELVAASRSLLDLMELLEKEVAG